jgi:hypothetical protein
LVPRSKNASASATQIGTPVVPSHQDEVLHGRGRHRKLSSPCTTNSSGQAGLPNNPRHQKVSPSKLAINRHSLGWRHIGTPRAHHLGCILNHYCSTYGHRPNTLDKPTRPRAGTIQNGCNSGPNQRGSPHLGRGRSNLPDVHLRPTGIEEANHQCLLTNVFGNLEQEHGGLRQYLSERQNVAYGNITAVDLEINFEHMHRAWDPQNPGESLFKKIQECVDYSESGVSLIGNPQQINLVYAKIFATGHFMRACRRWIEKTCHRKNLDAIQISRCCGSPSAQANAGRIRCQIR